MAAITYTPSSTPTLPLRLRQLLAAVLLVAIAGSLAASIALATRHDAPGLPAGRAPGATIEGAPARAVAATVHVVQPGDTLWTIARAFQPTGDIRPLVAALAEQTHGGALEPGQRVFLP
jgi:hypothetical protein